MTKNMTTKMRMVMALTMMSRPMAFAQQDVSVLIAPPIPGIHMQTKSSTNGQIKDELLAGTEKFAQGASEVTEINLDPNTIGMVGGGHGRNADLAKKMNFMIIHTYEYDKPGMYSMDDVEAYRKKLADGTWNCPVHVREKGESTDICSRTGPDHETNEMVILTAERKELTFIHMSGKMSLSELSRMSGQSNSLPRLATPPAEPRAPLPPPPPPVATR